MKRKNIGATSYKLIPQSPEAIGLCEGCSGKDSLEICEQLGYECASPEDCNKVWAEENPAQIGCGYCAHETGCSDRDPKVNKAKQGCQRFLHHETATQPQP
jgi:hypothetical protein